MLGVTQVDFEEWASLSSSHPPFSSVYPLSYFSGTHTYMTSSSPILFTHTHKYTVYIYMIICMDVACLSRAVDDAPSLSLRSKVPSELPFHIRFSHPPLLRAAADASSPGRRKSGSLRLEEQGM